MIIQCRKCGTRYRFDEELIQGEGAWVRCSRCRNVSFQESPSSGSGMAEEKNEDPVPHPRRGEETLSPKAVRKLRGEAEIEIEGERSWTLKKIAAYAVLLLMISGGLFFWFLPESGKRLLEAVPGGAFIAEYLGMETPKGVMDGGIDFVDVRDSFIKNWVVGDLMVVSGTAVNRNGYPVSKLRIRAKLLDSLGQFVREAESYGGNVLSDDDLIKLTEKEIREKLMLQSGSDASNVNMAPDGKVPFMVVFIDPPKSAVEFIVETASIERSTAK